MPDLADDPLGAASWTVTQILKDLQNANILPIKIVNMKHQEGLRSSAINVIYLIDQLQSSKMDSPGYITAFQPFNILRSSAINVTYLVDQLHHSKMDSRGYIALY